MQKTTVVTYKKPFTRTFLSVPASRFGRKMGWGEGMGWGEKGKGNEWVEDFSGGNGGFVSCKSLVSSLPVLRSIFLISLNLS
jgi:hypothetical protein